MGPQTIPPRKREGLEAETDRNKTSNLNLGKDIYSYNNFCLQTFFFEEPVWRIVMSMDDEEQGEPHKTMRGTREVKVQERGVQRCPSHQTSWRHNVRDVL